MIINEKNVFFDNYFILPNTENTREKLISSETLFVFGYCNCLYISSNIINLYNYLSSCLTQLKADLILPNIGTEYEKGIKLIKDFAQITNTTIDIYNNLLIETEKVFSYQNIIYLDNLFKDNIVEKIIIKGNAGTISKELFETKQITELTQTTFKYEEKCNSPFLEAINDTLHLGKVNINADYLLKIDFNNYFCEKQFVKLSMEIANIFKPKENEMIILDSNTFEVKVIFEDGLEIKKEFDESLSTNGFHKINKIIEGYFPKMINKPIYLLK